MGNVEFKLNSGGVMALLKSAGIENACKKHAETIKGKCGDGYAVSSAVGSKRARATVYTATNKAKADNFRNNTLLKARG